MTRQLPQPWYIAGARRFVADVRGTAAIEMAFAFPAVVMFMLGIVQLGRAMWLQNIMTYSVAEAARCATINQTACGTTTQIQGYASSEAGYNLDSSVFTVTTPTCGNRVAASYAVTFGVFNLSLPVTLTADACYPK